MSKPSNNPQTFNTDAWYYEYPVSIQIYCDPAKGGSQFIGRITVRRMKATLGRLGYRVEKIAK